MTKSKGKIFISYSRKDSQMVKALVITLEATGVDVFIDKDDIKYGERWSSVIEDRIKNAGTMFVYWSENAAASEYVRKEYLVALENPHIKIIPCLLDETPLPPELSQFQAVTETQPIGVKQKKAATHQRIILGALAAVILGSTSSFLFLFKSRAQDDIYAESASRTSHPSVETADSTVEVPKEPQEPPPTKGAANTSNTSLEIATPTPGVPVGPNSRKGPDIRARARAPQQPQSDNKSGLFLVLFAVIVATLLVALYVLRSRRKRLINSIAEIIVRDSAVNSGA